MKQAETSGPNRQVHQAFFNIPKVNLPSAIGLVFHHAYLVYDQKNNFHMASNPVPLKLVK